MWTSIKGAAPFIWRSLGREANFPTPIFLSWGLLAIVNLMFVRRVEHVGDAYLVVCGVFVGFFVMEGTGRIVRGLQDYRRSRATKGLN